MVHPVLFSRQINPHAIRFARPADRRQRQHLFFRRDKFRQRQATDKLFDLAFEITPLRFRIKSKFAGTNMRNRPAQMLPVFVQKHQCHIDMPPTKISRRIHVANIGRHILYRPPTPPRDNKWADRIERRRPGEGTPPHMIHIRSRVSAEEIRPSRNIGIENHKNRSVFLRCTFLRVL